MRIMAVKVREEFKGSGERWVFCPSLSYQEIKIFYSGMARSAEPRRAVFAGLKCRIPCRNIAQAIYCQKKRSIEIWLWGCYRNGFS